MNDRRTDLERVIPVQTRRWKLEVCTSRQPWPPPPADRRTPAIFLCTQTHHRHRHRHRYPCSAPVFAFGQDRALPKRRTAGCGSRASLARLSRRRSSAVWTAADCDLAESHCKFARSNCMRPSSGPNPFDPTTANQISLDRSAFALDRSSCWSRFVAVHFSASSSPLRSASSSPAARRRRRNQNRAARRRPLQKPAIFGSRYFISLFSRELT